MHYFSNKLSKIAVFQADYDESKIVVFQADYDEIELQKINYDVIFFDVIAITSSKTSPK